MSNSKIQSQFVKSVEKSEEKRPKSVIKNNYVNVEKPKNKSAKKLQNKDLYDDEYESFYGNINENEPNNDYADDIIIDSANEKQNKSTFCT